MCVQARKDNAVMIPDRERTPPLNELLHRFHGARYMTSINLSQAFLHIPLKKDSSSAFVRALKLVLGSETSEFVACCVNDILLYTSKFRRTPNTFRVCVSEVGRCFE
jgi:hypothetical protein